MNWTVKSELSYGTDPETRRLYEAGLRMLSLNYSEVKQLKHYFGLIEQSIILIETEKGKQRNPKTNNLYCHAGQNWKKFLKKIKP